jgi:hypothetical protein
MFFFLHPGKISQKLAFNWAFVYISVNQIKGLGFRVMNLFISVNQTKGLGFRV